MWNFYFTSVGQRAAIKLVISGLLLFGLNCHSQKSDYYIKFGFENYVNPKTFNKVSKISKSLNIGDLNIFAFYMEYKDSQSMLAECSFVQEIDKKELNAILAEKPSGEFVKFEVSTTLFEFQKPEKYEYYLVENGDGGKFRIYLINRMFWKGKTLD